MSYLFAEPEFVAAAATDLANIGEAIGDANAAAVFPTTGAFIPAGADAVSTELAALFGSHAEAFQALSAQAAAFHDQFVQLMNFGSQSYALSEAANVSNIQAGVGGMPPQQTLGRTVLSEGVHPATAAAVAAQAVAIGSAATGPVGSAVAPAAAPVGSIGSAVAAGSLGPVGSAGALTRQPIASPPAGTAEPTEVETATVSALPAPLAARAAPAAAVVGAPVARVAATGEGVPASS